MALRSIVFIIVYGWVFLTLVSFVLAGDLPTDFYEILGVSKQATAREIRKAFKKLALQNHPDKNPGDDEAHEKFLRINRAYEVLKDDSLRKKYDMYGEDGLKEDGPSGRGYKSWNFYYQDFGIYDDDPEIITLSQADFEQLVENTDDVWFINFYSPQCHHCHDLAPTWREVARELEGVIRIGAVNCGDELMLCRQQGIRSYPSLFMFPQREKYFGERTRAELIAFALRSVQAPVVDLWDGNFQEELADEARSYLPWLITFCGDGGDCLEMETCQKLAAMLMDLANVAVVNCHSGSAKNICKKLKIDAGTYYFGAGQVAKGKGIPINSLDSKEIMLAVLSQMPEMRTLDKEEFQEIISDLQVHKGHPWLIHFVQGDVHDLDLRKLPALIPEIEVGRVNCRQLQTRCNDLHVSKLPAFVVFKLGGAHEVHHGRMMAHDVAAFAREASTTPVEVLGPKDFPARVVDKGNPWFVDFFAPWCPPCMRLLPEFRKASREMKDRVRFGTVDCTVHTGLCSQYNIRAYPTTVFFNQSTPHEFHGHHSVDSMVEFLEDTLHPPVIILTATSFESLVNKKSANELWLVDFYAPWCGPCQQLAPEWRQLAKMLSDMDKIKVGQVNCDAERALCTQQGVQSYPTIRLYPMGSTNAKRYNVYQGWFRDAGSLRAWTFEYLPSAVTSLNADTFQTRVLQSADPWVIDFYAPWCGHCQVFAPEFEQLAVDLEGIVNAGKVDCDTYKYLCRQAGIRAYPTVRFYRGSTRSKIQNIHGEDINSQDADYIASYLKGKVKKQRHRDEL